MNTPENPPAFPAYKTVTFNSQSITEPENHGMSLRDYFAASVVPAILSTATGNAIAPEILASGAYLVADAMLKERAKTQPADQ